MSKGMRAMLLAGAAVAALLVFVPQIYVWISARLGKSAEIVGG